MPQFPNARIPFGDIMQAIEDQLVIDAIVTDRAQITWGTPDHIDQFSGPFDILLVARNGQHTPYDGGAGQLPMRRLLDIWYRSEAVADPGGGFKTWISETFVFADSILNSVANDLFWPEDDQGNLLTVESIKLVGDAPPAYQSKGSVFGDYVCTLECIYFPAVDPSKGPFPMP